VGPFDRFNDRAKRVLALAQDEAIRFNHNYIGAEHLLLGLMREGEGVAARALDALGVDLSRLRTYVESNVGRGTGAAPSEITLSPQVKRIIALAIDEARRLGHSHVGTEHLMLGMVRDGEGTAAAALASLGVSLEKLRHQVISTIGQQAVRPLSQVRLGRATAAAQTVGSLAGDEALKLGHDWIGTEHFLLALLRPELVVTSRVLERVGVTYERALAEITRVVPRKDGTPASATLTPRAYGIIGYAKGFADATHMEDGTRAFLIALVADEDGIAAQVLTKLGATRERLIAVMDRFAP
jgi:ATP-dependent Clp protease ATP-binding subunit ClpA